MGVKPDGDGTTLALAAVMAETLEGLQHADALLRQGGASLADVVKIVVYVLSMDDLPAVDRVLRHLFKDKPPAVIALQIPELAVRGARVDFEIIAYRNKQ
jgi:2-iminobutanoate/2-iminopropanoate deaminase